MIDVQTLGWDVRTVGELDHRLLKAPRVKLRSANPGPHGDIIYCVDLRVNKPNAGQYLTTTELHSVEHFLLEGLQRYLPQNFLSIGIMGCQTGFYIVLLNEGRAEKICEVLENIFKDMQNATEVPYANIEQCGNYQNHSLEQAQAVARRILAARTEWLDIV
ncbi:MAG: serine protease [Anaerolineae bacterium]|nr:MAG: serine protease [Anaerolineae bacterium]